jgi:hypothetical protein
LTPEGCAKGDADDGGLSQGSVYYAVLPELLHQALGGQEHPAPGSYILAHYEHGWVALHLLPQCFPDGFNYTLYGHGMGLLIQAVVLPGIKILNN